MSSTASSYRDGPRLSTSLESASSASLKSIRNSNGESKQLLISPSTGASEGWLELFLTPSEKQTFSHWNEDINDKSLTHRITKPLFQYLSNYIPDNVAPNVVTLTGFLMLGQAWYLCNLYSSDYPVSCTWLCVCNIFMFFLTNSIEPYHSARIKQQHPLNELFKYMLDCCSTVFLTILTTYCLGGANDSKIQWYSVQSSQLVLFLKHLSAFHRNAGLRYNVLSGPGEVILMSILLLLTRAVFGLDWFLQTYQHTLHQLLITLPDNTKTEELVQTKYMEDPSQLALEFVMLLYYTLYVVAVIKCLLLKKPHGWSRFGLSCSLLMRLVPAVLLYHADVKVVDVICDGLFMAVLTSDVTLAKMAGREIHPWVVVMSMAAVLSSSTILTLVLVYYIAVFGDLCSYMNMPLLTTCRNVYCDGVYDLCHIGHKLLFQKALSFGNRLFVGVVGDEDASHYKRPPIMSHAERCAEVENCKSVTKVIPNAPCFGLTQEFLDLHEIHVVAFGEEYLERYPNPDDDPYYRLPRKLGIAKPLPRTKGLSTSDLIRRIQEALPADEKKSPT